jgi:iron complex transport system substrate-binding protein
MTKTKIIAIAIVVVLVAVAAIAAVSYNGRENTPEERIITDLSGNEVTIPGKIDKVAITSMSPMVPIYIYYMNGTNKLVGANSAGLTYAKAGIMGNIYGSLDSVNADFVAGVDVNEERLIQLDPDLVFYTGNRQDEYKVHHDAGLNAVGFPTAMSDVTKNGNNPMNHLENWLNQMGVIFGNNGRGDSLIDYNNKVQSEVADRLEGVTEKPKVMIVFSYTQSGISVAGDNHYSQWWIESTGGVNVASGFEGTKTVNMEQIIEWDPDIIYFAKGDGLMPSDVYDKTYDDWSAVTAVKNEQVWVFPSMSYFSYAPALENALTMQWMAQKNHPEEFTDFDLEQEIKDYFKKFFNYNVTEDDIEDFLNPEALTIRLH